MNQFWIKILSVPLLAAALVSCPKDAVTGIAVTGIDATATPATIASAATSSLNATISGTGAFSPAVNWSIESGGGSLSASTGGSVTYTAPVVTSSTAVQIKATAAGDSSVSKTLSITVHSATSTPKPTINAFSATPASLTAAGQVTLSWDVSDATSLSVDSGVGAVTGTSKVVSVTSSTAFTLTATNANGSSTKTVTVTVASLPAPPTVVSVSPPNGATGVTADAKIVVTFSKPMDPAATEAAYQSSDLPAANATFNWDASGKILTIKPNAPLEYAKGTTISIAPKAYAFTLTGAAKDTTGTALAPLASSFTTLREITATLLSEYQGTGWVVSDLRPAIFGLPIYVGDSKDNLGIRAFVSFNLPGVPSGLSVSNLVRATLDVVAVGESGSLIYLTAAGSTSVSLNVDHVFFGESLSSKAYNAQLFANSTTLELPAIQIDPHLRANVLAAVRDDLAAFSAQGGRSQFRFGFVKETGNVGVADQIWFGSPLALILEYQIP